jgi:hypothetical protein
MLEPRRLTALWVYMTSYTNSFVFLILVSKTKVILMLKCVRSFRGFMLRIRNIQSQMIERPLEGPRRRWVDNIKMDLRDINFGDTISVAFSPQANYTD